MKEVRLWPKHIWDESAVLLGKHWGTLREPHENLMRTHWEQENNQKKDPLLLLLPFTKPKRKKKTGPSYIFVKTSHWLHETFL